MQGIMFKPDMIQAIIEGRKTNTRRLGGLKEINQEPDKWVCNMLPIGTLACKKWIGTHYVCYPNIKPRYRIGETVYIKEAYCNSNWCIGFCRKDEGEGCPHASWHSPMMMPEWAARHFILIEGIKAERVQEIENYKDEAGYKAEGVQERCSPYLMRCEFIELWNSINPDYPFESNPWDFAYTFRLKDNK